LQSVKSLSINQISIMALKSISDLLTKLAIAQAELNAGEKGRSYQEVLKELRKRIRKKKRK
jgi:hypothetical protein